MPGVHCVIYGCTNGYYRLERWKAVECDIHNTKHDFCPCAPPFKLYNFPKDHEGRARWITSVYRKDVSSSNPWVPTSHSRVCSVHFHGGKPTTEYQDPCLQLGDIDHDTPQRYMKQKALTPILDQEPPVSKKACNDSDNAEIIMADDDVIMESSSSPSISNPGTPAQNNSKPGTPAPSISNTIKPETLGNKITMQLQNQLLMESRSTSSPAQIAKFPFQGQQILTPQAMAMAQNQSQSKYTQFLAVIEDMGRDIRPSYAGNKTSMERLKRGIVHARILVRECLMECERSARS